MYGTHNDEVQLPMDFQIADANELSAPKFRKLFDDVENNPAHGWPEYFFSNHDQARQWDRYGDGKHNDEIAKLMAALELLPPGHPSDVLRGGDRHAHHGAHPGGGCARPGRRDRVAEGQGPRRRAHADAVDGGPAECGVYVADGEAVAAGAAELGRPTTWRSSRRTPDSILNFYKQLLALRRTEPALVSGGYVTINPDDRMCFRSCGIIWGMAARCWWR